jgi:hypothetical protein
MISSGVFPTSSTHVAGLAAKAYRHTLYLKPGNHISGSRDHISGSRVDLKRGAFKLWVNSIRQLCITTMAARTDGGASSPRRYARRRAAQ